MAVDLQQLSQVLEASLDPTKNKQGLLLLAQMKLAISADQCTSRIGDITGRKEAKLLSLLASDSCIKFLQRNHSVGERFIF